MHTCSAGCGPSSFTKRNGRAFCTVISCNGGLTLDKLPAPPTVGGASGIAVTGRGSMWRSRIRGSLPRDRKSTRLNSSHEWISYAVFCLKKKKENKAVKRRCDE